MTTSKLVSRKILTQLLEIVQLRILGLPVTGLRHYVREVEIQEGQQGWSHGEVR